MSTWEEDVVVEPMTDECINELEEQAKSIVIPPESATDQLVMRLELT